MIKVAINLLTSPKIRPQQYLAYGLLESGHQAIEIILRVYLLIFYTEYANLSPLYTTAALAIAILWDAVTDPLMGLLSDAYKHRVSRPLQAMVGGFLTSIFFIALFHPANDLSQWQLFGYLLFNYLMLNTGFTIASIPYIAMAAEMSNADRYRTNLFGWRIFFGNLGLVLGSALPAIFAHKLLGDSYGAASYVLAGYLLVISIFFYFFFRGFDFQKSSKKSGTKSSLKKLRVVFENKNYRILLLTYFIINIGLAINSALAIYYYKYTLQIDEVTTKWIIVFFLIMFSLSLIFWVYSVRFIDLKKALMTGLLGLGWMTVILYPIIPTKNLWMPILACIIAGFFVGCVVLLDTAIAKIADSGSSANQDADFGLYFGIWRFSAKASRSAGLIVTGFILKTLVLDEGTVNRPLAWYYGPGVGLFILIAAGVLCLYKPVATKVI